MKVVTSYRVKGDPEVNDKTLSSEIQEALGMSLEDYALQIVHKVKKDIGGGIGKELHLRGFRTNTPKQGGCFNVRRLNGDTCPDIVLGFTGSVEDFTITLIHELLHLFRWDERMVEAKAKKIYKKLEL